VKEEQESGGRRERYRVVVVVVVVGGTVAGLISTLQLVNGLYLDRTPPHCVSKYATNMQPVKMFD